MNNEIEFSLSVEETNHLLKTLGQLPNSSNTYVLLHKIEKQAIAFQQRVQNEQEKGGDQNAG